MEPLTINVDMDKACIDCGQKGATQSGLCLACIRKNITRKGGGPVKAKAHVTGFSVKTKEIDDSIITVLEIKLSTRAEDVDVEKLKALMPLPLVFQLDEEQTSLPLEEDGEG